MIKSNPQTQLISQEELVFGHCIIHVSVSKRKTVCDSGRQRKTVCDSHLLNPNTPNIPRTRL